MKTRNYTPEIKERAVRMLIEASSDYPSTWSAIQAIASKIGCTPEDTAIMAQEAHRPNYLFLPQYKLKAKSNVLKSLNAKIEGSSKPTR